MHAFEYGLDWLSARTGGAFGSTTTSIPAEGHHGMNPKDSAHDVNGTGTPNGKNAVDEEVITYKPVPWMLPILLRKAWMRKTMHERNSLLSLDVQHTCMSTPLFTAVSAMISPSVRLSLRGASITMQAGNGRSYESGHDTNPVRPMEPPSNH